jgi:dTDP-4-dehydrorhamnose reductase
VKTFNPQRILITGGKGMLGSSFERIAKRMFESAEVLSLGKDELDVTNARVVASVQRQFQPDLILHCAALVNAELCETEPELAKEIILIGTKNLVDSTDRSKTKLIYPQSFLVYDCKELPITEATQPNPSFVYGHEKYHAEKYIRDHIENHIVVVMAGFFGGFEKDKNFVGKIIPSILQKIGERKDVIEIGDRIWQPTYTDDLAHNTLLLATRGRSQRYCLSSFGECSFAELASEIIDNLGIGNRIQVKTIPSGVVAKTENAKRPQRAVVSNQKAIDEGLCTMRDWRVSLKEYLSSAYFLERVKNTIAEQR